MTPMATIATLRLATRVDSSGAAIDTITRASVGQQISAVARLNHLAAGETVAALWYTADGTLLAESDQAVRHDAESGNMVIPWTVVAGANGACWVEIWVGTVFVDHTFVADKSVNSLMNSIVFFVG